MKPLPTDGKVRKCLRCGCEFQQPQNAYRSYCKPCGVLNVKDRGRERNTAACKKWRESHRTAWTSMMRRLNLKRNYGLTHADYEALLRKQDGCCAICGAEKADSRGRRLFVDHCHNTGRVRGLLCFKCNFVIGLCCDSTALLEKAKLYLEG
jgi:hypothetical protein